MDFGNTQRTRTKTRVLPDRASSNSVLRDVLRGAASHASPRKRTRHGERGMKDTDHFFVGVPCTSAVNGSTEEHRGCAWRGIRIGSGQNTELGWSDPTFGSFQPPKDLMGSLQPSVSRKCP